MKGTRESSSAERWALDLHLPPALQVGWGTTAQLGHSRDNFSFAKQGRRFFHTTGKHLGIQWAMLTTTAVYPSLPQHGEMTSLCPGQWQSWNQDLVLHRTQSRLNYALLTSWLCPHLVMLPSHQPQQLCSSLNSHFWGVIENASTGEAVASQGWGAECCSMVSIQLTAPRPGAALTASLVHLLPPQVYSSWTLSSAK